MFNCVPTHLVFRCQWSKFWQGTDERLTKDQSVIERYRCGKCAAMDKNAECLWWHWVEALEYFKLLGMRYNDTNAVTQRA